MKVLFFNEKKHKYGVKLAETDTPIIDALENGMELKVINPDTKEVINDVIRQDPINKKYFLETVKPYGRLDNIQVL